MHNDCGRYYIGAAQSEKKTNKTKYSETKI